MRHNNISPDIWSAIDGLSPIINALYSHDGAIRIVGGAVRDAIRSAPFSDIDLATYFTPETVMQKLNAAGIKTIPTGLKHGTITAVSEGNNFEITTLRRDIKTDGRHAQIAYSDSWQEDAARRDFTMNALYTDPLTGEIFDYFNGIEDLKLHKVKFIGDPYERIKEDHLRILRFFRFIARFENAVIDQQSIEACKTLSNRQMALARERISDELLKMLSTTNPLFAVKTAFENDIFEPFLPEINSYSIYALDRLMQREIKYEAEIFALRRLSALLPNSLKSVDKIASRLKFSNAMRKAIIVRIGTDEINENTIRKIAFLNGYDASIDQILLHAHDKDISTVFKKLNGWTIPTFDLRGGDIIALGITPGPMVSKTLNQIKSLWVNSNFPQGHDFEKIVRQTVNQNLLRISSEDKNS